MVVRFQWALIALLAVALAVAAWFLYDASITIDVLRSIGTTAPAIQSESDSAGASDAASTRPIPSVASIPIETQRQIWSEYIILENDARRLSRREELALDPIDTGDAIPVRRATLCVPNIEFMNPNDRKNQSEAEVTAAFMKMMSEWILVQPGYLLHVLDRCGRYYRVAIYEQSTSKPYWVHVNPLFENLETDERSRIEDRSYHHFYHLMYKARLEIMGRYNLTPNVLYKCFESAYEKGWPLNPNEEKGPNETE